MAVIPTEVPSMQAVLETVSIAIVIVQLIVTFVAAIQLGCGNQKANALIVIASLALGVTFVFFAGIFVYLVLTVAEFLTFAATLAHVGWMSRSCSKIKKR